MAVSYLISKKEYTAFHTLHWPIVTTQTIGETLTSANSTFLPDHPLPGQKTLPFSVFCQQAVTGGE